MRAVDGGGVISQGDSGQRRPVGRAMSDAYEEMAMAIQAGEADALSRLREVVAARREALGEHARWGRLCEQAGEAGLACTEYQLARRDDPDTLGVYPVRLDNTVTFFAFDIDIRKQALTRARGSLAEARRVKGAAAAEAERLRAALERLGVPALLEDSGYKGRHLWIFLETPEDAAVVRQFGGLFLKIVPVTSPDIQAEFFPKQAATGAGIGNLIKLPVGIHRRTGRRSRLLQSDGTPCADPYAVLRQQPRLSRETLYAAIATLKARLAQAGPLPAPSEPEEEAEPAPPDKAAVQQAFPTAPPAWTAADFDTNPEIAHLLRHCAVLTALKTKVEEHRRLTHDEQVVLTHSLGHSGSGVLAVNYLLDACVDVPPTARLQSPLAGNPVSCPKIRKRIPHITGAVPWCRSRARPPP